MDNAKQVKEEHLTIFIIVRKDLSKTLEWQTGAVISQACHAVSAVLWENLENENVKAYMKNMETMHKVTLQLKNESQLLKLEQDLKDAGILHRLWIEQPENIPTAIATCPYKKSTLGHLLKKCQLYSYLRQPFYFFFLLFFDDVLLLALFGIA